MFQIPEYAYDVSDNRREGWYLYFDAVPHPGGIRAVARWQSQQHVNATNLAIIQIAVMRSVIIALGKQLAAGRTQGVASTID